MESRIGLFVRRAAWTLSPRRGLSVQAALRTNRPIRDSIAVRWCCRPAEPSRQRSCFTQGLSLYPYADRSVGLPSAPSSGGDCLDLEKPRGVPDLGHNHGERGTVVAEDLGADRGVDLGVGAVSYTHLRAHETDSYLV